MVVMKRVGMGNHIVVLSPEDKLGIVGGSPRLRAFDGLSDLPPMWLYNAVYTKLIGINA